MVGHPHAVRSRNRIGYMVSDRDEVMNKYEEALYCLKLRALVHAREVDDFNLKNNFISEGITHKEETENDVRLLQELVERATPMKVTDKFKFLKTDYRPRLGICPKCAITNHEDNNFCNECGQALDWSEE